MGNIDLHLNKFRFSTFFFRLDIHQTVSKLAYHLFNKKCIIVGIINTECLIKYKFSSAINVINNSCFITSEKCFYYL